MPGPDDRGPAPVVIVVGALAPYTHVLYEGLAARLGRRPLHVLACSARETSRQWDLEQSRTYRFEVLPGLRWHRSSISNLYINPSVVPRLRALAPAALILNDFAPTMLIAAGAARLMGIPYGLRTDGVPETDPGQRSMAHRLMRRALVPAARFGLGPSQGSADLLEHYGLPRDRIAFAPLVPAWQPTTAETGGPRPYDVLFCGMLNETVKGGRFFTDVVLECRRRGRALRVRVVGEGPLRDEMTARFAEADVEARFDGFLQQEGLAGAYHSAALFHFPSRGDVWGLVVQEAMQSGTVVMASPHSGAARELVEGRHCGLVLPLEVDVWATATIDLLDDPVRRESLREAGRTALMDFTPERAVEAYLAMLEPLLPR